jgi:hypothetical protein
MRAASEPVSKPIESRRPIILETGHKPCRSVTDDLKKLQRVPHDVNDLPVGDGGNEKSDYLRILAGSETPDVPHRIVEMLGYPYAVESLLEIAYVD